jgi:hypothetical protein
MLKRGLILSQIFVFLSLAILLITLFPPPTEKVEIPFSLEGGESGSLTLKYPERLQAGVRARVTLQINFIPNTFNEGSFERQKLLSRLDLGGVSLEPEGEITAIVHPQGEVMFNWTIPNRKPQSCSGTIWLFLEKSGSERQLILAKELKIESTKFLGISYKTVQLASLITLVASIYSWILLRIKKSKGL